MQKATFIIVLILAGGLLTLGGFTFKLYSDLDDLKTSKPSQNKPIVVNNREEVPESGQSGEIVETPVITDISESQVKELKDYIDKSIATISATKTTVVSSTPTPKIQTSYITMNGTATTTSTDWVDIPDSGVYIDVLNDYGEGAKVTWEASLKVANANGQAFARLWDDTNKIAVTGSELTTTNNSEFKQVASGNLALWRGKNLYKVQIKSLNSFVVTYSSGRVKISY